MKDLTNVDLDVMNATKEFPKNDDDAFIYIRAERKGGKTISHIQMSGIHGMIMSGMSNVMIENKGFREAAYDSVLNALTCNPDEIKKFQDAIDYMINKTIEG